MDELKDININNKFKAKFIYEELNNLLKPKTKEEIIEDLKKMKPTEILDYALKYNDKDMAEYALENGAKIKFKEQFDELNTMFTEQKLKKHMSVSKQLKFGLNVKNAKPNELLAAGVKRKDTKQIKTALRKGATNTDFLNGEAMMLAIKNNDIQLGRMLMKHPNYNPTKGGRTEMMFPGYDNAPLKRASQLGRNEFVKMFLNDERTDPSSDEFKAIKEAIKHKHWNVLETFFNNDNVIIKLDNKTTKTILRKLTKLINKSSI